MIKVGLTGNIGSGKTTVAKLFSMQGIPIYYADERGRYFLDQPETRDQVKSIFGSDIILSNGMVDRKKLASVVFSDPAKLKWLNNIIHPLVREDFLQWCAIQTASPYVIKEAAILVETAQHKTLQYLIVVKAPLDMRVKRVCERDGVSPTEVRQRMSNQMDEEDKAREADFIIENDGKHAVLPQVLDIHHDLLKKACL